MVDHGRDTSGMLNKWQEESVLKELEELIQVEQNDGGETEDRIVEDLKTMGIWTFVLYAVDSQESDTAAGLHFGKLTGAGVEGRLEVKPGAGRCVGRLQTSKLWQLMGVGEMG